MRFGWWGGGDRDLLNDLNVVVVVVVGKVLSARDELRRGEYTVVLMFLLFKHFVSELIMFRSDFSSNNSLKRKP